MADPRDIPLAQRAIWFAAVVVPVALTLYALPTPLTLALAIPYWAALFVVWGARITLLLHVVVHRPIFRRDLTQLNRFIPWVVAPFLGHTPTGFYIHHIGMHHAENNEFGDLSCTLPFRRDHIGDWMLYAGRFLLFGMPTLARYLIRRGRTKMLRWLIAGELGWLAVVCALAMVDWAATLVVFVVPLFIVRVATMMGNFAQHAFVDVDRPSDPFRNSTCLLDTPYNDLCYNDGYHIVHHLYPSMHWSEMADYYTEHEADFARHDAVVFSGLKSNQRVWWLLMRQDYETLAAHLVDFHDRKPSERVAWLTERVQRTRTA